MSGIAGVFWLDGKPALPAELQAMADTMRLRGPDGITQWCEGSAGLLRTLLATTPEATAAHQPWPHPDSGCVVVSDARLDNRPELLRELGIDGHCDRVGDAELLHAAWQRWGEDCPARLLGDFAFAILDTRRGLVFCARDPMGVRPLVYHHQPGRLFAFATQTEALLAIPGVPATLDEARIADYLCGNEGIDRTSTFFRALLQLPAGHSLTLHDGTLHLREYWSPLTVPRPAQRLTHAAWVEGLGELTAQAVKACLRASTGVGSMLSGGLDSSSVVALANALQSAEGKAPIATFSAISHLPDCPETAAVRRMASLHPQQAHFVAYEEVNGRFGDLSRAWPRLGEPFDASMTLLDCQYAMAAEQGVPVVMDGADPDSLLSEGNYLATLLHRGHWLRAWREAAQLAGFHGVATRHALQPALLEAFKPLVPAPIRRLRRERGIRQAIASAPLNPDFARRMDLVPRYMARSLADTPKGTGVIGSGIATPHLTAGIHRYDRVASRRGIEPRHPFLDRRLLEYCAWMPQELRLRDGYPKWALRQAMADHLPGDIAWRRGKEHLGYRFNHAVLASVPALTANEIEVLAPYADVARLAALPDPRQCEAEDPRVELLFNAAALARWLLARDAGGRAQDPAEHR